MAESDLTPRDEDVFEPKRSGTDIVRRFIGHIDAIVSSGFVEGWASDLDALDSSLLVSVRKDGLEVAWGLANRYRDDLAEAGCGTGWCAFRLRISLSPGQLRNTALVLADRITGQIIYECSTTQLLMEGEVIVNTVNELLENDPTILRNIAHLRACDPVFKKCITSGGPERFITLAYGFVLQRAPDNEGLALYAEHLRNGTLTGFQTIAALAESPEYLERRPQLSAPIFGSFPFFD